MVLHFFIVHDNHGEFYEWGIEGDQEKAYRYLQSISNNVKFTGTSDVSPKGRSIGNRKYIDGVICRTCKFKYRVGVIHNPNELTG